MRILLLGKNGQLGWELHRTLAPLGQVIALGYPQIDLLNLLSVISLIQEAKPQVIINAAAYNAVDRAESEAQIALAVNGIAPGVIAETALSLGAALIHYTTDYIYDGTKGSPYTEDDLPNPLCVYGRSKLAGERAIEQVGGAHLIFRSSWLYSLRGNSFVTKVLRWARQNTTLRVVTDQIGSPTWARMLAEMTAQLLAIPNSQFSEDIIAWFHERRGGYHLAGSGCTSRLEWANSILRLDPHSEEQIVKEILPAITAEFPTPARRPLFSALDCRRFSDTFGLTLPDWESALQLAME